VEIKRLSNLTETSHFEITVASKFVSSFILESRVMEEYLPTHPQN